VAWRSAALCVVLAIVALAHYQVHWWPTRDPPEVQPFPVHLDEHLHWGFAKAALEQRTVSFGDPFSGEPTAEYSLEAHLHERGFHAYLGAFQGVTGIPWEAIFGAGPVVVALLLALAVYALAQRWGAGLEAALWVAAIPTTLRFLGPGFLVPIAFALPILVAGLIATFAPRSIGTLLIVAVVAAALWPIHVIAAVAFLVVAGAHALLSLRASPWGTVAVLAALVIPFFLAEPFYSRAFREDVSPLELPLSLDDVRLFGVVPLLFAGIGAAALVLRGKDAAREGTALAFALGAAGTPILVRALSGNDPFALYDRSVLLLYLVAAILGGAGLAAARRGLASLARRGPRPLRTPLVALAAVALVSLQLVAVASAVGENARRDLYLILDEEQHAAFVDAAQRLGPEHTRAIVDARASMAFTAITGRPTLFVDYPWSATPRVATEFFASGAEDTHLLVETRTTIVVTRQPVRNPDLVPLNDVVYVLRPDYVARMGAAG